MQRRYERLTSTRFVDKAEIKEMTVGKTKQNKMSVYNAANSEVIDSKTKGLWQSRNSRNWSLIPT